MIRFFISYAAVEVFIVVAAVLCTCWYSYKRRHPKTWSPPHGFQPSGEIFIDPTTGVKQRVWYNPTTGERKYEPLLHSSGSELEE